MNLSHRDPIRLDDGRAGVISPVDAEHFDEMDVNYKPHEWWGTHLPNITGAFPQLASGLADGEALIFGADAKGKPILVTRGPPFRIVIH